MKLWLDRETKNDRDLTEVGTYRYAETAKDLLVSYAIDDDPAKVWDVASGDRIPDDLEDAMVCANEVWAHNAQFDRAIHNGPLQAHLPRIGLPRWRCSMAMALSHALPGGLAELCQVLQVGADQAKDAEGKKLIRLFCMPQPKGRKVMHPTAQTHPTEWARFKSYAASDITAMRACVKLMPTWNWDESAVEEWHCDQRINERGFAVDRELIEAGARAAVKEKARIAARFAEITGGEVRPSQRAQFLALLQTRYGLINLDNTRADTFLQLLKHPSLLDPEAIELMTLSMAANKTSTAKYAALLPMIQDDGRFRGALQFAGASRTRRWAGRGPQFQNLPSRGLPKKAVVDQYIADLKMDVHEMFHEELMRLGAAALRGMVVAN